MLVRSHADHVQVIFTQAEACRLGPNLREYFRSMCFSWRRTGQVTYTFTRRRWYSVRDKVPGFKQLLPTTWQNV